MRAESTCHPAVGRGSETAQHRAPNDRPSPPWHFGVRPGGTIAARVESEPAIAGRACLSASQRRRRDHAACRCRDRANPRVAKHWQHMPSHRGQWHATLDHGRDRSTVRGPSGSCPNRAAGSRGAPSPGVTSPGKAIPEVHAPIVTAPIATAPMATAPIVSVSPQTTTGGVPGANSFHRSSGAKPDRGGGLHQRHGAGERQGRHLARHRDQGRHAGPGRARLPRQRRHAI